MGLMTYVVSLFQGSSEVCNAVSKASTSYALNTVELLFSYHWNQLEEERVDSQMLQMGKLRFRERK